MDDKQAAKSVLKKLSALRATLPDDEQIYLDRLILGMGKASSTGLEDITVDSTATQIKSVSGNRSSIDHQRTAAAISWNNIMEIYELE